MGDYVDQVNISDAMLSANTFRVKEEQCQEDSFVDDKMCISETTLTIDNAEIQGSTWHRKLKQYEELTCLNNIKTELASFQATEVQNDNVKMEGGFSADDVKIEFDNGLLYCEHCEAYYVDYCIECGMLVHILNKYALNNADSGEDIPSEILEIQDCLGRTGIYALRIIPAGVKFGPFTGLSVTECPWEMHGEKFVLDKNKWKCLNWMQYINPTRNICDINLIIFKSEENIYYQSTRQIRAGEELLVYFSEAYENSPNKIARVDLVTTVKDVSNEVFACTFCCLGFSSKSHLAKHKTICDKDTAETFSIEELSRCPFCQIHLDSKEYLVYHMSFCSKRNARGRILPTTDLNGRKRCLREIYKCEQCKYRTKYQADLKEHTSNHHYIVKVYKCGICNRRFKTEGFRKLHVANTHAYVGKKDDQEHSTTNYRNAHIKVEQSSSRDQKKVFKCSLCVFRTKYKQYLRKHMKTKHLNKFDYKCDTCEFVTNNKSYLKTHIKIKHLKQFSLKCDFCEYQTNDKSHIKRHIKTKHLKQFSYKCDFCEYETNNKGNLKVHIKTKHLKEFDLKCESCEYRTNNKSDIKVHIKNKHLKEFDLKCESCEYRTNNKHYLKVHIKNKHLKEFDLKCEACEYITNSKHCLEVHIKTKHLKEFSFKCASCEYEANIKSRLKLHIKTNHLKEFDFKCDSCDYETNNKHHLKLHIKTKHLEEFSYECDSCEYGTNNKSHIKRHIEIKHLKQFSLKCDFCEYKANDKSNLKVHIKTKHLEEFDYKCDSCEYGTRHKSNLKRHVKSKHLKNLV